MDPIQSLLSSQSGLNTSKVSPLAVQQTNFQSNAPTAPMKALGQYTPESFKSLIVSKHPEGVSSDGIPYAKMDAKELTQRIVTKYPDGVTNAGVKYSDYLGPQPIKEEHGPGLLGLGGALVSNIVKPFARAATNVINAGQVANGQPETSPLSGKFLGQVKPIGDTGSFAGDVKDSIGAGAEIASDFIGGGEAKAGISALKDGKLLLKPFIKSASKAFGENALIGGLNAAGSEMQNPESSAESVLTQGATGSVIGGTAGLALNVIGHGIGHVQAFKGKVSPEVKAQAVNDLEQTYSDLASGTTPGKKKLDKLNAKTDALNNAGTTGRTPQRTLAESGVIPNRSGPKLDTYEQAAQFREGIQPLKDANRQALDEVGLSSAPVKLDDLENRAIQYASTPENINAGRLSDMESSIKSEFNELRKRYPKGEIPLGVVDDIKSARWDNVFKNKSLIEADALKKSSEYSIAKSMQKTIEDIAHDSGHVEVAQLNREIGDRLEAAKFLEELNGKTIKGGRLLKYATTAIGSAFGKTIPGKVVGALGGNLAGEMIIANNVASPIKRLILRNLEKENPEAYTKTISWLKKQNLDRDTRLLLEAPKSAKEMIEEGGSNVLPNNGNTIIPPSPTTYESPARNINRDNSLPEQKLLSAPQPNSAQGTPLSLPQSVRETNLGLDEVRNTEHAQSKSPTSAQTSSAINRDNSISGTLPPKGNKSNSAGLISSKTLISSGIATAAAAGASKLAQSTHTETITNKPQPLLKKAPTPTPTPTTVKGYEIKDYATDPNHEKRIKQLVQKYESLGGLKTVQSLNKYIQGSSSRSKINGTMILSAAHKYKVDPEVITAIIEQDSSFGTKGKAVRTKNAGNYGNDDAGHLVHMKNWQAGINRVAEWLSKHKTI